MSTLSQELLQATSKGMQSKALLALEDGTVFEGFSCGAEGEAFGEICFNTSLEGYLEVITDPSYAGQIVVLTYPQIGNYGVNEDDQQSSEATLRGLVVHDMCPMPSNFRSTESLPSYLKRKGIVAIEGIDTRALVSHIRDQGALRAGITTRSIAPDEFVQLVKEAPELVGKNLVSEVSRQETEAYEGPSVPTSQGFAIASAAPTKKNIVAFDCGVKESILAGLERVGCSITMVPWNTPAGEVLALEPDGVFLSNGPGDPDAVSATAASVRGLMGKVPLFGICLGHQMICKAAGGRMEKLPYGHHGGNHPVKNLLSNRVEITAQNHGFNLDFASLGPLLPELSGGFDEHVGDLRFWSENQVAPVVLNERFGHVQLTHVNLNDGTAEGIAFLDIPAFSVQYHPEASPGPTDSHYLFSSFMWLMEGDEDYLSIDIAQDRLAGWRF